MSWQRFESEVGGTSDVESGLVVGEQGRPFECNLAIAIDFANHLSNKLVDSH